MKISDVQVIPFTVRRRGFHNAELRPETVAVQTVTRIVTDEGAEGYYFGGDGHGDQAGLKAPDRALLTGRIRDLVVGQDPFDRERFWRWMWVANIPEHLLSVLDNALWDLQGRALGVPVCKLAGGCRDRVLAYASTYPNLGPPEVYAEHALDCKRQGYRHYKIHPYYFWDRRPDGPTRDGRRTSSTTWPRAGQCATWWGRRWSSASTPGAPTGPTRMRSGSGGGCRSWTSSGTSTR